jgi:hypothetical protein
MHPELRFRTEVTPELLARVEPSAVGLLVWWAEQWNDVTRTRRRGALAALRWTGFGLSLVAVGLTGWMIAVTPGSPCHPSTFPTRYDGMMVVAVLFATVFGFYGRIVPGLQRWSLRMSERQARQLLARTRRTAPFTVEYVVSEGRLTGSSAKPRFSRATALGSVERAAFAGEVACLFGPRFPRLVKRLVWLPDAAARAALAETLRAAGIAVVDLG